MTTDTTGKPAVIFHPKPSRWAATPHTDPSTWRIMTPERWTAKSVFYKPVGIRSPEREAAERIDRARVVGWYESAEAAGAALAAAKARYAEESPAVADADKAVADTKARHREELAPLTDHASATARTRQDATYEAAKANAMEAPQ